MSLFPIPPVDPLKLTKAYVPVLLERNVKGSTAVTVSAKGISNGLGDEFNDGADFGPDTLLNATAPGQFGPPYSITAGIQEAINYAVALGGGKVYLKRGTYTVSQNITVPSNIELAGEGRFVTTIQVTATPSNTPGLSTARQTVIWLSNSPLAPEGVQNVSIHDLGIYIPSSLMSTVSGIYGNSQWQFVDIYNMYMVNAMCWNENAVRDSHDISIRNFISINSNGSVMLDLQTNSLNQSLHDVLIENIFNYVDQEVGDDRIVILGRSNSIATSGYNNVYNIIIRNIFVYVSSSVTSGIVNGIKLDPGYNTVIHNVLVDGVTFFGNASGGVNSQPVAVVGANSNYGAVTRLIIRNIYSENTNGIYLSHNEQLTDDAWQIIDGVYLYNIYGNWGINVQSTSGVNGISGYVLIKNFVIELASSVNTTNGTPVGILLAADASAMGVNRTDIKDGLVINGYTAISNNIAQGGGINSAPYTYLFLNVENVHVQNASVNFSLLYDNSNPYSYPYVKFNTDNIPSISTPSIPASGTALTNTNPYAVEIYLSGGSATEVQITRGSTTYTIWNSSTATAIPPLTIKLNPNDSITLTYSTAPSWTWLPA